MRISDWSSDVCSSDLHGAARPEAVERALEGILADRVIDHRHALAVGQRLYALDEVLLAVVAGVVAAVRFRQRCLFFRTDRADHRRADVVQPLTGAAADAAGGGVDQPGVSLLDLEGATGGVLHRPALPQDRDSPVRRKK